MTHQDSAGWGRYWAQGFVTSCVGDSNDNYTGSIRRFWDRRFAALTDGARILDIGTGNGAVAMMAVASAKKHDRRFDIQGIDLAAIDPHSSLSADVATHLQEIQFYPRRDICQSGFDNDSFDLITGNFALEYTNLQTAIPELARLTAPGGENSFVLHHEDSALVITAQTEQAHIELILQQTRLLQRTEMLIKAVGKVSPGERQLSTAQPDVDKARRAFNKAAADIAASIESSSSPELLKTAIGHAKTAYQLSQHNPISAVAQLRQARSDFDTYARRLDDLLRAALSQDGIEQVAQRYKDQGFGDIDIDTLNEDATTLLGWVFRARSIF